MSEHARSPDLRRALAREFPGALLPADGDESYARDASPFRREPLAVLAPRDADEAARLVAFCVRRKIPVTPRGGGTSLTGQSVGAGVMLDLSRHLDRVLEVHAGEGAVRVEAGVTRDALNAALAPHGLHFAPDPASGYAATVGGMIATNAAGMRSLRHGMTVDHVLEVDAVLADGSRWRFGPRDGLGHPAVLALRACVEKHREEIARRAPAVLRRSGGYRLDALCQEPFNPARVFCSAEGTLGVVVSALLRAVPLPGVSGLLLVPCPEVWTALRLAAPLVHLNPSALELLDAHCLAPARDHPLARDTLARLPAQAGALLLFEAQGDDPGPVRTALDAAAQIARTATGMEPVLVSAREEQQAAWALRSAALGLISHGAGRAQPQPYIEDAAVPLDRLEDYIREVQAICARHGREIALFAHASVGLLHVRPLHDPSDPAEAVRMAAIQREVFARVAAQGGSWSGEHGDGLTRGSFIEKAHGPELMRAFRTIKQAFDPHGILNPGKKIDVPPGLVPEEFQHLRPGPGWTARFRSRRDGGLAGEIAACNGVGNCRQTLAGVMCPSFRATRLENDTVRGRARQLQAAWRQPGRLGPSLEALSLCLGCKACKAECPNRVDMARLKAETLAEHFQRHGLSWRERLLSAPDRWLARIPSAWPREWGVPRALSRLLGFAPGRNLPALAPQRFSVRWERQRSSAPSPGPATVAVFIDTWTEFFHPEAGLALMRLLEALGQAPMPLWLGDSQRAAVSRGHLALARERGGTLFRRLDALPAGLPVLTLEPSCHSALTDDLPDLVDDAALGARVAGRIEFADAFLARELDRQSRGIFREDLPPAAWLLHPHCHARALDFARATLALCRRAPGVTARETGAGCCGLAGAWGYEAAHDAVSRRIAEDRFLPAIRSRAPGEAFAAAGFSCRCQAAELTGVPAQHPLELLAGRLATPST